MALKSWKQIVTDIANAFRSLTGSTSNIKVGELAGKVGSLNTVKFNDGYIGTLYQKVDPTTPYNVRSMDALESTMEVWKFTGHTSSVERVAVDADGNVYSGSSDMTVRKINQKITGVVLYLN